jgi:hypothetical protein
MTDTRNNGRVNNDYRSISITGITDSTISKISYTNDSYQRVEDTGFILDTLTQKLVQTIYVVDRWREWFTDYFEITKKYLDAMEDADQKAKEQDEAKKKKSNLEAETLNEVAYTFSLVKSGYVLFRLCLS